MFRRGDKIPSSFGEIKFPEQIKELIQSKRYANAAELIMSRQNIPFNLAFVFLSNCPEALCFYLLLNIPELEEAAPVDIEDDEEEDSANNPSGAHKKDKPTDPATDSSEKNPEPSAEPPAESSAPPPLVDQAALAASNRALERKRQEEERAKRRSNFCGRSCVFINLYLAVALPLIAQRQTEKEKKADREKLLDFCRTCKTAIDKNAVYRICRAISDDELVRSLYLLFGDIWRYSMLLLEIQQYEKIVQELGRLSERERAQVYKNFPPAFQMKLFGTMVRGDLPTGGALYPAVVSNTFRPDNGPLLEVLLPVVERMYTRRQLATAPQRQVFFHLAIAAKRLDKLPVIYNHDLFARIGEDYILRLLERRKLYPEAGDLCAHIKDRHLMGVSYAVMHSIAAVLSLLTGALKNAGDLRECWIRALTRSRPVDGTQGDEKAWRDLLEKSTRSGVIALDDIFKIMPDDMPIDAFQPTILRSLTEYKKLAQANDERIRVLTERSNEQRTLIHKGANLVVELDPMATCWICKMPIYKDKFMVFPCLHCVHVKCLLSNMNLYWDTRGMLQLIALASRAVRDLKKREALADLMCISCPICGELSLEVLDRDFVRKADPDREMWTLPKVTEKLPEPVVQKRLGPVRT